MPVRTRTTSWDHLAAMPWRILSHRFSFVVFMLLSFGLLIAGRVNPRLIEGARTHAVDVLAPFFDAVARPMAAAEEFSLRIQSYRQLQSDNEKLRHQNAQLAEWQNAVLTLQNENRELHGLLNYKTEPGLAYISARVIADVGGPFVRSLVVTAGSVDGVREGMAAMTGEGLIGRVVEVGSWSSRILLITDFNSRIPVIVAGTGDRAILAGDNSTEPQLLYLAQDASITNGARIITSGHGGIFPPGLPVGAVSSTAHGIYNVVPLADLGRINYVRLVDFSLKGGAFNTMIDKAEATTAATPR